MRWIDANKKPPRKSGSVLAFFDGYAIVLNYSAKYKAFNVHDEVGDIQHALHPLYWANLPKAPEGYEYV